MSAKLWLRLILNPTRRNSSFDGFGRDLTRQARSPADRGEYREAAEAIAEA
jgi:hypothetical protein